MLEQGLGREMITSLVDVVFSFPDAQRVTADIDKANKASERTLLSCGFELLDAECSRYVKYTNTTQNPESTLERLKKTWESGKRQVPYG